MPIRPSLVCVAVLAFAAAARASPVELSVVRVDEGLAYVNIGTRDGVAPGQALEVIDRATPNETFHLGWIVLESCGEGMSLARVSDEMRTHVKQGTIVRLPSTAHVTTTAAPPPPPPPPTTIAAPAPVAMVIPQRGAFRHDAPKLVPPGVPLTLTAFAPEPMTKPVLMYRPVGEHAYNTLPFESRPDSYYTVSIAPEAVQAPGIEYYIVVDEPDADRQLAFADPATPARVDVEGRFNETSELARYGVRDEISATSELVSYRRTTGGSPDYYYRVEGEYLHRIFKTIYSMRFGAGYLNGQTVENGMPETVGFLYAYSEGEIRSSEFPIAFLPRVIFGVNDSGTGGGFEARVRIGDELGMNFEAGLTVLSRLGFETFTTLTLHPSSKLAIALAAYLENLPVDTDLGFRSYVDVRYRLQHALWGTVRLGVAARSITTIGPDTGVGLAFGF